MPRDDDLHSNMIEDNIQTIQLVTPDYLSSMYNDMIEGADVGDYMADEPDAYDI